LKNNVPGNQILQMASTRQTIDTIKKRLSMFHMHKFELDIHSDEDSFGLSLQLELDDFVNPHIQDDKNMLYEFT